MEYARGTRLDPQPGPFSCGYFGGKALCPDDKVRTLHPTYDGVPDTFFSIPMFVYVGRTRVYGYATTDTIIDARGEIAASDLVAWENVVRFIPYQYRKHHALVEPV